MSMTDGNGYILADLKLGPISGRPGAGFHRIGFTCEYAFPASKQPGTRIQELCGTAWVRGSSATELLLGQVFPESPVVLDSKSVAWKTQGTLCLDLSSHQVEAIEDLRNGGDLNFRMTIAGIAEPSSAAGHTQAVYEQGLSLAVNQRTWIDVLAASGYGRSLLFEIPYPTQDTSNELIQAVNHLEGAKAHFMMGHYDETVAVCRKSLDSLTAGLGDAEKLKRVKDTYFSTREMREDMPIESRALFLRETVKHFAHPAAHGDVVSKQEHYDRKDARLILSITAAVLSYGIPHPRAV